MKPATAKRVGRETEQAAVDVACAFGHPAERRRLNGFEDRGDVSGIADLLVEVKSGRATLAIPQWLAEAEAEQSNTGDPHSVLVVRPKGLGLAEAERWWAITRWGDYLRLWGERAP